MRKYIARNIGLPLFDALKKKNVRKFYHEFANSSLAGKEEIEKEQFKKLVKLIKHADKNVPFYHRRFQKYGIDPNTFESIEDLNKIPPLTREDLQNNWKDIIATNVDISKLSKGTSSGSTGVPVVYYKDLRGSSAGQGANFAGWELAGWKLGMKGLHIWGNPTTVNNEWKNPLSKAKTIFYNHYKYPAYQLAENEKFNELYDYINKMKFDFIDGYTNAIFLLADYMQNNNLNLQKKLKFVLPTAENLQDFQTEKIEQILGPVYDSYGCSEINGIAYECRNCGMYHVIDLHVIVEFGLRIDNEGSCELLITDLDNYGFPLIRYQNGDAGVPVSEQEKKCNIQLSRIKKVIGRQSDIIYLKAGGSLTVPSFFGSMLLKKVNGIKQYQVIREKEDFLMIKFVIGESFSGKDEDIIRESLKDYLGEKIKYEIKYVKKIPVSKTGKFKLVIDKTKTV